MPTAAWSAWACTSSTSAAVKDPPVSPVTPRSRGGSRMRTGTTAAARCRSTDAGCRGPSARAGSSPDNVPAWPRPPSRSSSGRSLDPHESGTYLRFMPTIDETVAGPLGVRGAGPALSYELVGPTGGSIIGECSHAPLPAREQHPPRHLAARCARALRVSLRPPRHRDFSRRPPGAINGAAKERGARGKGRGATCACSSIRKKRRRLSGSSSRLTSSRVE
jgi:hypothetical protein